MSGTAERRNHVCTEDCLRIRTMFGLPFSWCSRFSLGAPERENYRTADKEFKLSRSDFKALIHGRVTR